MMSEVEKVQSLALGLWLQTKHLDGCNYCHVPKEMRDTSVPYKTLVIWWISLTLFKNSCSFLSIVSRRWWLEHYTLSLHPLWAQKPSLSRGVLHAATVETGFSKCLLCVFTFDLMHSDDTQSKHIHTETLHSPALQAHSSSARLYEPLSLVGP